jgi:hypothetical protein
MTAFLKRAPKLALYLWALVPHTKSQAVCLPFYHDCLANAKMNQDQKNAPGSKDDRALMQQWLQPNLAWISEEATSNKIAGFGVWVAGCIPKEVVQKSLCKPAIAKPFFDLQNQSDRGAGLFDSDTDSQIEKDANILPIRQTLWCKWRAPQGFWPSSPNGMMGGGYNTHSLTVMLEGRWTINPLSLQKRQELCTQMMPHIEQSVRAAREELDKQAKANSGQSPSPA